MCVLLITWLLRIFGRLGARKPVNHTSLVTVVTPTDRLKSVRNRCVIELFCGVVCVVTLPFWHFCWSRGFCHRTESDLFLFVIINLVDAIVIMFNRLTCFMWPEFHRYVQKDNGNLVLRYENILHMSGQSIQNPFEYVKVKHPSGMNINRQLLPS